MAKLLPVVLLAVFLTFVIASFSSRNLLTGDKKATNDTIPAFEIKQYWMVFLLKGPNREKDSATETLIQQKHMENINRLAGEGKLMLAGPFGGDDDLRGIFVMNCKDSAEAAELVMRDTAVITGRLRFEIRPWWTEKNCLFR